MKQEKYCISVDWLQVCCHGNYLGEGEYTSDGYTFVVSLQPSETPMFKRLYKVSLNNLPCAVVQQQPRTSSLSAGLTLIKLENRVLYCTKYIEVLYALIRAFHLKYKGITRLDICYDCNRFCDGRNPARFIKDFVLKSIEEKGGIVRRGSDKFACNGSRTSNKNKITSISFGSPSSPVRAYMYDKTLELQEVKDKPWIREMWELNGLVSNSEKHVWRSEISIKAEGKDLLNMSTGELFQLSPQYLEHYDSIEKLFHYYAAKYFDFRINTGQKNKRHFKQIFLFNRTIEITCKPKRISKTADTGRMERICANKIIQLSETYVDIAESTKESLYLAVEFLENLSSIKMAKYKSTIYRNYLNTIKAYRFIDAETIAYFEMLEEARRTKQEIEADYLYYMLKEEQITRSQRT